MKKEMKKFPIQCFFVKDSSMSYLDDTFKGIERIGGTFTYLENELS